MKVKIKIRDKDFIIDYMHVKDIHAVRYQILEFFVEQYKEAVLYIDSNNKIRELPMEQIKGLIENCGASFHIEPIEKAKRKTAGLGKLFGKSETAPMSENIILMHLQDGIELKALYDHFLMYYDYGFGAGGKMQISELSGQFKADAAEVLFNQSIFPVSMYDSIMFARTRTDAPYSVFEPFLKNRLDQ